MFYHHIILPLLAQVALTLLVWVYMYITRVAEMSRKRIDAQRLEARTDQQNLLTESAGPADNFKNLFEMPVLFYLAILLSLILLIQDEVMVQLAWGFVILRALHSLIHCTYNRVMHRFTVYLASSLLLMLMWLRLALFVLTQ
jgi:hypothetical protein